MAEKVAQRIIFCKNCNRDTIHFKNTKEINWLMHFVLAVFTMGLWLIVFFLMIINKILSTPLTGSNEKWTCSQCGTKS